MRIGVFTPKFDDRTIEPLARLLGEIGTHGKITDALRKARIDYADNEGGSKWVRLDTAFRKSQQDFPWADGILECIQELLAPVAFANDPTKFEDYRKQLNNILRFEGLKYQSNGQFKEKSPGNTIAEPEASQDSVHELLNQIQFPAELMKYCGQELGEGRYFHAVFEAVKGLAEEIRRLSGLNLEGATLAGAAFGGATPKLALNALETETDQSEQRGLMDIAKGCFELVRNPIAHEPRVNAPMSKKEAAQQLILIAYIYDKVVQCCPSERRHDQLR